MLSRDKFFKVVSPVDEICGFLSRAGGFDKLEVKIIRAMLLLRQKNAPRCTASAIAKEAKMSVTNAYKYLYALQRKGMIESNKDKNKMFWLSNSANPIPRLFSHAGRDYLEKKELFEKLEALYGNFVPVSKEVWGGHTIHEDYDKTYVERAVFLLDVAKEKVAITAPKIWEDYVLLDALLRASSRGVNIQFITSEADHDMVEKLKKLKVEVRLGSSRPYLILADGMHGITLDKEEKGVWFLNYKTDYNSFFAELWEKSKKL